MFFVVIGKLIFRFTHFVTQDAIIFVVPIAPSSAPVTEGDADLFNKRAQLFSLTVVTQG